MKVSLIGGSGFVGASAYRALIASGGSVDQISAPRLTTQARHLQALESEIGSKHSIVKELRDIFSGYDTIVNTAGLAHPQSPPTDALFGANALLPAVIAKAASQAGVGRFIHVSSAAVFGYSGLKEVWAVHPASAYGRSKALGETGAHASTFSPSSFVVIRPTSVHGHGRRLTASLASLARSPLASVAGEGRFLTPQVLVDNVGAAIAFLATAPSLPHVPVLQPHEGLTAASLLRLLSDGKEPSRVPMPIANFLARTASVLPGDFLGAQSRRLTMLWFGQPQGESWLSENGFRAPYGLDVWQALGEHEGGA